MWSVKNEKSENDLNYFVDDHFQGGKCIPTNAIKILELFFIPTTVKNAGEIVPFSYGICIFKDAKRVLSKEEIINDVHQRKAPFAKLVKVIEY